MTLLPLTVNTVKRASDNVHVYHSPCNAQMERCNYVPAMT